MPGLGGFASSTLAGINTRRYHGLLMAATQPPTGRMLLLSKLEETLVLGDRPMVVRLGLQPAFRGDPGKWTGEKAFVRSRQHSRVCRSAATRETRRVRAADVCRLHPPE